MKDKEINNWGGYVLSEKGEEIEIPHYFSVVSCDKIKVRFATFEGEQIHIITKKDVMVYFKVEAHNISGCRTIGTITGDWRPIDELANELLHIFTVMEEATGKMVEQLGEEKA